MQWISRAVSELSSCTRQFMIDEPHPFERERQQANLSLLRWYKAVDTATESFALSIIACCVALSTCHRPLLLWRSGCNITLSHDYLHILQTSFIPESKRHDVDLSNVWFQYHGATNHAASRPKFMNLRKQHFPNISYECRMASTFLDLWAPGIFSLEVREKWSLLPGTHRS